MKLALLLALSTVAGFAETSNCWLPPTGANDPNQAYGRALQRIKDADEASLPARVSELVNIGRDVHCFVEFAGQRDVVKSIIRAFENSRTDKQSGAGATGAGTTSVVSRGASAKVLGFAVENGALTQSVKGQVVTFTGNLAGIPSALIRKDIFTYCDPRVDDKKGSCISSRSLRFLRKVSFGASFDASRDSQTVTATPATGTTSTTTTSAATPVTFRGTKNELSSVTARYEFVNRRDVTSKDFQTAWRDKIKTETTLNTSGQAVMKSMRCLLGDGTEAECGGPSDNLLRSPAYLEWNKKATARMLAAQHGKEDLAQAWTDLLSELVTTFRSTSKDFQDKMDQLRAAFRTFDLDEDNFAETIGTKPLLSFEYANNRPVGQTSTSTFRLIGELGWAQKNNLTFNFATAIFDSAQPAVAGVTTSRLRDLEAAAQYERKLGQLGLLGAGALDFSVYFQNQRSASLLNVDPTQPLPGITFVGLPAGAKTVYSQKGNIGIGQLRLVLGPDKSNVRIPLAVSWSNRTELIAKPTWRAQIGLSYDFDALFAK